MCYTGIMLPYIWGEIWQTETGQNFPLTVSVRPVVVEAMPDLLVDGRHRLHVALPPLTSQVFCLHFEKLEDVQLHHCLLHLQRPLQDGCRLKYDQHLAENG